MINVLVVEDSAVVRELLVHILNSDSELQVIGTAKNGEEALEAVHRKVPDVITMDIYMPRMDGYEATRRIMETHPTRIVIVSASSDRHEAANAFRTLEAGALAIISKPTGIGHPDHEATAAELVQTVKLMAEVKVVRRSALLRPKAAIPRVAPPVNAELQQRSAEAKIVAIGASTGGPVALKTILSNLPKGFPIPIIIAQHIATGFVEGLVESLSHTCELPIHVASHGKNILPGHVYVAPDGFQTRVEIGGNVSLTMDRFEYGMSPSVSCLFHSIAMAYGQNAIGVLLTGMGKDGVDGLKRMKEQGAVTIAQDKESSVVHGMPGEAIKLDAVSYVFSPDQIAGVLRNSVNERTKGADL